MKKGKKARSKSGYLALKNKWTNLPCRPEPCPLRDQPASRQSWSGGQGSSLRRCPPLPGRNCSCQLPRTKKKKEKKTLPTSTGSKLWPFTEDFILLQKTNKSGKN